jgi:hypothetical protein
VTGTVVPQYLVSGKLVTQGVDNLDVSKESSTAGITGYHCTQHAAYQEGPGLLNVDEDVMIFSKASLQVLLRRSKFPFSKTLLFRVLLVSC